MDPLSGTLKEITGALERLGVRYAIGGSLASSARSVWRTTLDVDIIADFLPGQAEALVQALGKEWYADVDEVRRSVAEHRSFNLIHMLNLDKVDMFPAHEAFHRTQLERASVLSIGEGQIPCVVTTAEDILLAKLRWYRDGGEVSDRQWSDVGCILVQNPELDWDYVNRWAARLSVADLLAKARVEAEL